MVNRHLLRIKILQISYAYFTKEATIEQVLSELDRSVKQTKELYAKLLLIPLELRDIAEQKLANQENAIVQKTADVSLSKFVDNTFLSLLQESKSLQSYIKNEKVSWAGQEDILLSLYYELLEKPFFQKYLVEKEVNPELDKRLVYVCDLFEEQNLYWNDDLWVVLPMLQQAVKKQNVKEEFLLPPLYRNAEDEKFAKDLLLKMIRLEEENKELIQEVASNWGYERIALIDKVLLGLE